MQEGKAIAHRNTDFGAKLNGSSCLTANHRSNLSLWASPDFKDKSIGVTP
jgi:hypothetical protein